MCGIFGYIGKLNAFNEVYKGLKLLQYRGYDSCGIAFYLDKLNVVKSVGSLDNLTNPNISTTIAFGHTRWATNGAVNINNTHPQLSFDGKYAVVHNGIIENAEALKNKLISKGVTFNSDTDTEVVANLLAFLPDDDDLKIPMLFKFLKGTFALIIGTENQNLYVVKKFNPLNILKNENGIYISSDIASLNSGELYSLNDYDVLKISNNEIVKLTNGKLTFTPYTNDIEKLNLGNFKHFMLKEINETPKSIASTYEHIKNINFKKIFKHIKKITFVGCGTAYHSCLIGAHVFKDIGFITNCELASNYESKDKIKPNHLHIIVSQSGETADCIKAVQLIKQYGGKTAIITNETKSTITKYADYVITTKANKEMAVASTKTYCCQVFVFTYISKILLDKNFKLDIVKFTSSLACYIKSINILPLAKRLKNLDKAILIGKGLDYLILQEASLKIREIDYIYTLPMYAGELKHGTLSLIDENSIVLSLNTSNNKDILKNAINEITSRGGKIIQFERFLPKSNIDVAFKPIYSIIPFQLLSYYIALEKGQNPDMPRNLAKSVTVE